MKQRREKDIHILKNPDLGKGELRVWSEELFLGPGTENFDIPETVLEFGFGVMDESFLKAKESNTRNMILRKILHTREVVEAGVEIVMGENSVNWNLQAVGAVTFLHDMGRFPQAHFGSFSDAKTGFDHAEASAEMLLGSGLSGPLGKIDLKRIAEAIREHSRLAYSGVDEYGKFVRDADKLGLLNYIHYHMADDWVPEGKLTPGALKAFLEGRLVPKVEINSRIDVILCWLSWIYDINYSATKELFKLGGAQEYILSEVEKVDLEVFRLVKQNLEALTDLKVKKRHSGECL